MDKQSLDISERVPPESFAYVGDKKCYYTQHIFAMEEEQLPENGGKSDVAKREEEILALWEANGIFKKSEEKEAPNGDFIFYDGPPFANGLPHYGHILAGTLKDAIPRYKTMCGFRVRRRWGWDCHGLPVENLIEKELGLKGKKDIAEYGVERFNEAARVSIMKDAGAWKKSVPRLGRWADMEHDYKTMDTSYTESVWWSFKTLYDKGLVYEGYKAMQLCPRCGTTLSNFEVSQGYKDIVDFAVTVKLELADSPKTYLLAWTTTPWTLPGNMAAAVNRSATYVEVSLGDEKIILAKDRVGVLGGAGEIVREFPGTELIGKRYAPPFSYYLNANLEGKEHAWKVYHADYVSLEEGTGIVHLAPVFGEEDMEIAKEHGIPLVHHVGVDGAFTPEVKDFAGMQVKPKEDHQAADIEIIKNLAHRGLLFKKEKITHSYPHCWRCDTPLLNYAASSWFVKVTAFRDKLVAENKKINWVPSDIRDGRFGKWLEGARDWAISRSRFWGAPIPVWRGKKSKKLVAIGSIEELKTRVKTSGNRYFVMRHGQAEHNVLNVLSSFAENGHRLTDLGKSQAKKGAEALKGVKIDYIFMSPFIRARETADIVAEATGFPREKMIADPRLGEWNTGEWDGRPIADFEEAFPHTMVRFEKAPKGGESYAEIKKRAGEALYEFESKYRGKNIVIVTHEATAFLLIAAAHGWNRKEAIEERGAEEYVDTGELREVRFTPLPHNHEYEIDLHRPYIDDVELAGEDGEPLLRVPDVFDCWFESGSMPFASNHYPFERKAFDPKPGWLKRVKGYPADFIAEGLDQTRGWFYSLLVLGVALFGKSPYKNVIVNGTVLAEDGQKMSKRLKNYPDPMDVVRTYGADAVRYYLLSSPVVRGDDFNFSEKGVGEVMRKNIGRLSNVLSFYKLYEEGADAVLASESPNILDRWIFSRLGELIREATEGFERYELDKATRPIGIFIDDLSTWYLRRSRERFKGDDRADFENAIATLRGVLLDLSKLMAPITPFFAEYLYGAVRGSEGVESVHLEHWPSPRLIGKELVESMGAARSVASRALEARTRAGIKVRQPLALMRLRDRELEGKEPLLRLIRDEVNVKEIVFDETLAEALWLDTGITKELQEEGMFRELVRAVQGLRKEAGLSPKEKAKLLVSAEGDAAAFIKSQSGALAGATLLSDISFGEAKGERIVFDAGIVTLELLH